jgi:hypothetical protein
VSKGKVFLTMCLCFLKYQELNIHTRSHFVLLESLVLIFYYNKYRARKMKSFTLNYKRNVIIIDTSYEMIPFSDFNRKFRFPKIPV